MLSALALTLSATGAGRNASVESSSLAHLHPPNEKATLWSSTRLTKLTESIHKACDYFVVAKLFGSLWSDY